MTRRTVRPLALALLALLGAAAPARAALTLPPSLVGREWDAIPTTERVAALTFDAGGDAAAVRGILWTLRRRHVPATFFLTGQWTLEHPASSRAIGDGYVVGCHANRHVDLTRLATAQIRSDVHHATLRIRRAAGVEPHPLFRFPYGASDARVVRVVNGMTYGSIRWTVDTLGWEGATAGVTPGGIVRRVVAGARPGMIVLMHVGSAGDGTTLDAAALGGVVSALRARGYRLIDLHEAIALAR